MDVSERAIPNMTAHFLMEEARARYIWASLLLDKKDLVLDIASGSGYGSSILSNSVSSVIGIDIDPEAISYAFNHFASPTITFIRSSAEETIFKENTFDAIVAFEMIEHVNNADVLLIELNRVLKKNGTCIISTPNKAVMSPNGSLMSPYHTKEYSHEELKKLLGRHFKKVHIYGQKKSLTAQKALKDFIKSQSVRQSFVDNDRLGIRKLFPKQFKEKVWKYMGALFGRQTQESLNVKDFPISIKNVQNADYFVVVCTK